jgi:hypothetical protein
VRVALVEEMPGRWVERRLGPGWQRYLAELGAADRERLWRSGVDPESLRRLRYRPDAVDVWPAPETVLRTGMGDCEDHYRLACAALPERPALGWRAGTVQEHVWPVLAGLDLDFSGLKEIASRKLSRAKSWAEHAATAIERGVEAAYLPESYRPWARATLAVVAPELAVPMEAMRYARLLRS